MLEEEFPVEEDSEETEIETQRLEMEIVDRFVTDENCLLTVMVWRHKALFFILLAALIRSF